MNKGTFAKEAVVEDYLTALLTDDISEEPVQREIVAKLLESTDVEIIQKDDNAVVNAPQNVDEVTTQIASEVEEKKATSARINDVEETVIPTTDFQALFFKVAGLTLALPLTELGGIHKLNKIGPLFGKPNWFKGVMLHREEKLSVVDTAMWVMPEKHDDKLAESLNYQYLIMLDSSSWGLACESLVTTSTLAPTDVKWRAENGKRPWLAGMVKDKMCALVNVKQLIKLLDKGLGSNDK